MIFTFYSYKGGVGRSMALANVAELYYNRGLKVLMIDFDLEAPGLERYFDDKQSELVERAISARGVIDMVLSFRELQSYATQTPAGPPRYSRLDLEESLSIEPIDRFIVPIVSSQSGRLDLLPAGHRRNPDFAAYAKRVLTFDWADFYAQVNGERFFERLRRELAAWDVVLIDSRTGVTEIGGVCTHHLADAVVSFVATNHQNFEGTLMMAQSLTRKELLGARGGRPLHLLFAPSRVELSEEDRHDEFAARFDSELASYFPSHLRPEKGWFVDLRLIYVPAYSYMERVAVRESDRASKVDLVEAYRRLARFMAALAEKGRLADAYFEATGAVSNAPPPGPPLVGRSAELERMHAALVRSGGAVLICGLSGIGKTSLACAYVAAAQKEYKWILWLDATAEEGWERSLSEVERMLGVSDGARFPATRVRSWLDHHDEWLLVIDELLDVARLREVLPQRPRGRIIITARRDLTGLPSKLVPLVVELAPFSAAEGAALLNTRLGRTASDPTETLAAEELAAELGGHPLAIEVAAANIRSRGTRIQDFLLSYRKRGVSLLDRSGEISAGLAQLLESLASSPASRDVLNFAVFLDRDVPIELLIAGASVLGNNLQRALRDAAGDPLAVDEVLEPLARAGLLSRNPTDRSFQVHPLALQLIRESLSRSDRETWHRRTCGALLVALHAANDEDVRAADRLIPHVLAALRVTTGAATQVTAELWLAAGRYYLRTGHLEDAGNAMAAATAGFEKLGDVGRNAIALRLSARVHEERGQLATAKEMAESAVRLAIEAFGPDHRQTSYARLMLATILRRGDSLDESVEQLQLVRRGAATQDDQDLRMQVTAELASVLSAMGRHAEAEDAADELLMIGETKGGFAYARAVEVAIRLRLDSAFRGDSPPPDDAESLLRRALSQAERSGRAESPTSLSLLVLLGDLYLLRREFDKAAGIYHRALSLEPSVPAWALLSRLVVALKMAGNTNESQQFIDVLKTNFGSESAEVKDFLASIKSLEQALMRAGTS